MNVFAINGSPRKTWNTAKLLQEVLKGAASQGAETELIHLYDISFKGCTSCFGCKLKGGKSYGKCVMSDGLTPVLEKLAGADAFVLGSPIYFGTVTGEIAQEYHYPVHFGMNQNYIGRIFGQAETLCAYETLQFEDYDKVVFDYFDPVERRASYEKSFPENCRKAFELGVRLATGGTASL